jgi:hypothetical protein
MRAKDKKVGRTSGPSDAEMHELESCLMDIAQAISNGAPASRISQKIAGMRLQSMKRILSLQGQLDEGRRLEAAGNPLARKRTLSARFALADESRAASLLDRQLTGLSSDLSLEFRGRLEEAAKMTAPASEKSEEELQDEYLAKICLMIVQKARVFDIPLPTGVKEAAASRGIKLASAATKGSEDPDL